MWVHLDHFRLLTGLLPWLGGSRGPYLLLGFPRELQASLWGGEECWLEQRLAGGSLLLGPEDQWVQCCDLLLSRNHRSWHTGTGHSLPVPFTPARTPMALAWVLSSSGPPQLLLGDVVLPGSFPSIPLQQLCPPPPARISGQGVPTKGWVSQGTASYTHHPPPTEGGAKSVDFCRAWNLGFRSWL